MHLHRCISFRYARCTMHGHKARDNRIEPQDGVGERILKMEGLTRVHAWARDAVKLEQLKTRPKVGRAQGLASTNTNLVLL